MNYSSLVDGGSTLYGPFAASHSSYDSCSHVQNVGSSAIDITSSYFYQGGGNPFGGHTEYTVPARGVATFYVPDEGVGTDFVGSVKIVPSAGQIAGIHTVARKPAEDDFGASYNLPQR